jgi:hypothetical protein
VSARGRGGEPWASHATLGVAAAEHRREVWGGVIRAQRQSSFGETGEDAGVLSPLSEYERSGEAARDTITWYASTGTWSARATGGGE